MKSVPYATKGISGKVAAENKDIMINLKQLHLSMTCLVYKGRPGVV